MHHRCPPDRRRGRACAAWMTVLMLIVAVSALAQQDPISEASVPVAERSNEDLLRSIDDARFTDTATSITILIVA